MLATTLQFRSIAHRVLDAAQIKVQYSYTDKPRPGRVIGVANRRYVGLQVAPRKAGDRAAVVAEINARLQAAGVDTRAEWRAFHIRGVCIAAK